MPDFTKEELIELIKITESLTALKVNREEYFTKNFSDIIDDIIEKGPIKAGISIDYIIEKAQNTIQTETAMGSSLRLFDLVPAETKIGNINLKLIRYVAHLLIVLQKLCYLFDMPYFDDNGNIKDDEVTIILIYFGVMSNDDRAIEALSKISELFSRTNKEKIDLSTIIDSETILYFFELLSTKLNNSRFLLIAARTFYPDGIHLSYVKRNSEKILNKFIELRL